MAKIVKTNKVEATEKEILKKVARGNVYSLNEIIANVKVTKLSKDGVFALLDTKVEIAKIVEESQKVQQSIYSELRKTILDTDNVNSDLQEEIKLTEHQQKQLDKRFNEYINKRFSENIELRPLELNRDDFYELVKENGLKIELMETLSFWARSRSIVA